MPGTTVVMGASTNPERYSYKAILRLRQHGHSVVAIGRTIGAVGDVMIQPALPEGLDMDTVTMYLAPARQGAIMDAVLAARPRRIIFNPGAENPEFAVRAREQGVEVVEACTLVLLSIGAYNAG